MEPMRAVITARYRGKEQEIEVDRASFVSELQEAFYFAFGVPAAHQKLLAQRPVAANLARILQRGLAPATTISEAGITGGMHITVLGATEIEVRRIKAEEGAWARRNGPRQYHLSMLRNTKPRSTTTPAPPPVFLKLAVHPGIRDTHHLYGKVMQYLERLANDPAVLHVCRLHAYKVGMLSELLPHEHPQLLGLNENRGQRILLRIRTDDADGTRDYKTTRRVLMHELAHNDVRTWCTYPQISGHPPEFKVLNSLLNKELEAFERAQESGSHTLRRGPAYEPATLGAAPGNVRGGAYVLGGKDAAQGVPCASDQLEERRRRILQATEARLAQLDKEIDTGCGNHLQQP
ncbi:hypothetical protein MVES1_002780 [Malassezia vespertilionis]|uniref:WLM domain-containing protein n=1 Tax=Malassezia vespertilionis TaxID=2020962 RepID=A0A2N1JAV7_9BASI|nr:uncharacterized protein MVES1_002780 [Malassezia vespertilionis]PKI83685.1 hypothetical protein MVES_002626 [Malassezia vespertilionis]WFD07416.1 hypothetical protein MVES1_002780 [Malassezia vespertilionis]